MTKKMGSQNLFRTLTVNTKSSLLMASKKTCCWLCHHLKGPFLISIVTVNICFSYYRTLHNLELFQKTAVLTDSWVKKFWSIVSFISLNLGWHWPEIDILMSENGLIQRSSGTEKYKLNLSPIQHRCLVHFGSIWSNWVHLSPFWSILG